MAQAKALTIRAHLYIIAVSLTGAAVLGVSIPAAIQSRSIEWLVLAGLALLTGSFTVKIPSVPARLSVSETFVFAAVLLYGPEIAAVIVALDVLVMSLRLRSGTRATYRLLFNTAAGSLAIWLSGHVFLALLGTSRLPVSLALERLLLPLAALSLCYFLLNSWLIAIALSFERGISALRIWRTSFLWLSLNYLGGASVATLLVSYTQDVNFTALGFIVPLLFITYLTFRTSMGRLEDANRHVSQLNELYLSAIETLAMAVDAKDQITHGHIRRVQVYATELAKCLGVKDERQLKAIEAAALLHDMGKLAIPEHILNKPGKLSAGEFETMKRHADIGADLLSSIRFPYPVVPIVRHHHENWNGTGYPNRIAGTDIPLGARILSVVDCFDALTSDRPYRPRLSRDAAFAILRERRGLMYDPLIVDTFVSAYESIAPAAVLAGQEAKSLLTMEDQRGADKTDALRQIYVGSTEGAALLEARRLLNKIQTPAEAVTAVSTVVRQFTPATVVALYEYDSVGDTLRCAHATGDAKRLLVGLEIRSGERTSGWVAANQRAISNSAAALDLSELATTFNPPLLSALSTPILEGATIRGVLTLYSTVESPFKETHEYMAEQLAGFLGESIHRTPRGASSGSLVAFPDTTRSHALRK